jgi:hypothetical protein
MLTEARYVEQQRALGRRIHEHDGVWWEELHPFYCKPAFVYKAFDRGAARPPPLRRLLGYSHQVLRADQANRMLPVMVLTRDRLDGFGLQALPQKKRNNVRRALENGEVRLLADVESELERIREINLSQALRHDQGAGSEISARRYTAEADDWRAQMRREASLEGREWWGAYVDGVLAAYVRTFQVDGIRIIQQAKADTDHLKSYPMDAIYFTLLGQAAADPDCRMILNGRPQHPSLNHYKEQFLFRADELPYYSSHAGLVKLGKRALKMRGLFRRARDLNAPSAPGKSEPGPDSP